MHYAPVSPFPFLHDLRKYHFAAFWRDLLAAFSVALLALPQAIAYAFVAGLPPSSGIFAAVFGTIFTAAFGASRSLVAGPTTAIAILIQSGTAQILFTYYRDVTGAARDALALEIVMQIVLLVGLFQLIASLLRLGRITQFASRSVVVGYMLGVATAIVINQLYPFFGIPSPPGYHPLYMKGAYFFSHLPDVHPFTSAVGIGCLALIAFFYRLSKKIPSAVLVFALAASLLYFFDFGLASVGDVGPLYTDLPKFHLPRFSIQVIISAVPLAFAIAVVSLLEATSIGRQYSGAKEPPYRDNQELFGLGMGNFLSSFFGALPSSGSFSRSALNRLLGARTRFAAIFSGLILLGIVYALGFVVVLIPITAISALLLYIACSMIDFRDLALCLRTTKGDFSVVLATFFSSLIFTLDVALYIGIALSILLYLKRAGVPLLIEYGFNNIGKLRPIEAEDERADSRICILQAEGELFFGAADLLQSKVRRIAEEEGLEVVILQLFNVRTLDASICLALRQIARYLRGGGRIFMLTGVAPSVARTLRQSGVDKEIGKENLFAANEQLPSEPTRTAYAQAKFALQGRVD